MSIGPKLRDLFTSRHSKFLEAELVRVRLEYQAEIRRLREELQNASVLSNRPLEGFSDWLRRQKKTIAPAAGESTSYAEELAKHNAVIEKLDQEESCRSSSPSPKLNGRAAAARSPIS